MQKRSVVEKKQNKFVHLGLQKQVRSLLNEVLQMKPEYDREVGAEQKNSVRNVDKEMQKELEKGVEDSVRRIGECPSLPFN